MNRSASPVRSCVVTRRRAPVSELLRLRARDGRIELDVQPGAGGRGAWVSADRAALEKLQAHPGIAWRTLKVKGHAAGPLLDDARQRAARRVSIALRACWRSGLLRRSDAPGLAVATLLIGDAAQGVPAGPPGLPQHILLPSVCSILPPKLVACAPLVLLLREGAPSRRLIDELRRQEALG